MFKRIKIFMNRDLETFNYFVDDLLTMDENLLKYELDFLLMKYLFNTFELEAFKDENIKDDLNVA